MKIFRRVPGPRVKKNVLQVVLFLPLLIAAIFWSSGCAGVVSAGNAPQQKQALLVISFALPGWSAPDGVFNHFGGDAAAQLHTAGRLQRVACLSD